MKGSSLSSEPSSGCKTEDNNGPFLISGIFKLSNIKSFLKSSEFIFGSERLILNNTGHFAFYDDKTKFLSIFLMASFKLRPFL